MIPTHSSDPTVAAHFLPSELSDSYRLHFTHRMKLTMADGSKKLADHYLIYVCVVVSRNKSSLVFREMLNATSGCRALQLLLWLVQSCPMTYYDVKI
jgi:hypothetical protein